MRLVLFTAESAEDAEGLGIKGLGIRGWDHEDRKVGEEQGGFWVGRVC